MPTLDELQTALVNAHKAGDTVAATALADEIVKLQPKPEPSRYEKFLNLMQQGPTGIGPMGLMPGLAGARLLGEGFNQANKKVGEWAYAAGGAVTDITGSPMAGYATNVGIQAIPAIAQGQIANQVFAPALEKQSIDMMQRALKPTIAQLKSGEGRAAAETLLKEGLNPTIGGTNELRNASISTSKQLAEALRGSTADVNVGKVGAPLTDTMNRAIKQANPLQDIQTVKDVWNEFRNLHPEVGGKSTIPVQLAQELKQGTYAKMADKYGELGSASVEAQKAIARGLKDEISAAVPEAASLNARNSNLLDALDVTERRALLSLNNNPGGIAWLAENKSAFAAFLADKSTLFKSLLARLMYQTRNVAPNVAGAGATIGNEAYQQHLANELRD
jgi:hypothetical protein